MGEYIEITTISCIACDEESTVEVPQEEYDKWENGTYVQDVFKSLTDNERELLVSGIHERCWEYILDGDEEDDVEPESDSDEEEVE